MRFAYLLPLGACAHHCCTSEGLVVLRDHTNRVCGVAATVSRREQGPWRFGRKLDSEDGGASFSNHGKTYAKDKLSKYATTVLLVCCYLYRKRSNVINVNAEAKEQGRDTQTPVDDSSIFTEVSRSS